MREDPPRAPQVGPALAQLLGSTHKEGRTEHSSKNHLFLSD